jgi:hypothetical protein
MVEHRSRRQNGRLICTLGSCVAWGIPRKHVKAAQADAIRRGLVYQTEKGTASKGAGRRPSKFGLGWLPAHDGAPAANLWKRYRSALNPREDLKSSSAGGTKLNGGSRQKQKLIPIASRRGTGFSSAGVLGKGNGRGPPGCDGAKTPTESTCGRSAPARPAGGSLRSDGVGDELERAARGELLAWREERGR